MMTSKEYMDKLESCLECLTSEERENAIRYYGDYFFDAGEEHEQEVISELGSPEKLAREIIREAGESASGETQKSGINEAGSFRSIDAKLINSILTLQIGDSYSVDLIYPDGMKLPKVEIAGDTLSIIEEHEKLWRLFSMPYRSFKPGRINITVPDTELGTVKVDGMNGAVRIGAVRLDTLDVNTVNGAVVFEGARGNRLHGQSVNGAVTAKSCYTKEKCHGETVNGEVRLSGNMRGKIHAETVNGSITFDSSSPIVDYSINAETVNGSVRINGEKYKKSVTIEHPYAENGLHAEAVNGSIALNFMR